VNSTGTKKGGSMK